MDVLEGTSSLDVNQNFTSPKSHQASKQCMAVKASKFGISPLSKFFKPLSGVPLGMKLKPKQVDAMYKDLLLTLKQQQPESAVGSSNNRKPESASLFWSKVLK